MKNSSTKNIIWSYVGIFFTYGFNLFLLPLVLKYLSSAELGLWYTFASVGTTISLLDFGFSPCIMRNVGHVWGGVQEIRGNGIVVGGNNNGVNYPLLNDVIRASRDIYSVVSVVVLIIALVPGTFYINSVLEDINPLYGLSTWGIYGVAVSINLYFTYWNATLRGLGGVADGQKANIAAKIVQFSISLIGLIMGFGLWALSVAYLCTGVTFRFLSKKACLKILEKEKFNIKGKCKDNQLRKNIMSNSIRFGIATLSTQIVSQSMQLICTSVYGLEASARYGLSVQLLNVIVTVGFAYYNAVFPEINIARASGDLDKQRKLVSMGAVAQWIVCSIGVLCLIIIGPSLIGYISDKTMLETVPLIILSASYMIEYNRTLFTMYISTSNKLPYTKAVLISSLVIAGSSVLLPTIVKVPFVVILIIRLLVESAYNGWKWMITAMKDLELKTYQMFKIAISSIIISIKHNEKTAGIS